MQYTRCCARLGTTSDGLLWATVRLVLQGLLAPLFALAAMLASALATAMAVRKTGGRRLAYVAG